MRGPEQLSSIPPGSRLEFVAVSVLGLLGFIGWTLHAGPDLNWDLLNYHVYVGLHASGGALGTDFFPASTQSYLTPYAYWPLAMMIAAKWPAMLVGSVMAAIHSLTVVAAWYLSKQLFAGGGRRDLLLRVASTCTAVASPMVLTEVGTSFIDITSAIPAVFGVAFLLKGLDPAGGRIHDYAFAGLGFGIAAALKLSNAPFAMAAFVVLTGLWFSRKNVGLWHLLVFGSATAAGFVVAYGYWGYQLWREFGNPFFPLFNSYFQSPAQSSATVLPAAGPVAQPSYVLGGLWDWLNSSINRHQRFIPRGIVEWLLRPLYMLDPVANVYTEVRAPDARYLALFCLAPFAFWKVRTQPTGGALRALLLLFVASWIMWLATSGNGRYLLPLALIAGPALIACLAACAPRPGLMAQTAVAALVFVQAALMWEGAQYRWDVSGWQGTYIVAKLPQEVTDRPVTFVSLDGQSASWLAVFVDPASRFVSPAGAQPKSVSGKGADRFSWMLEQASEIYVIFRFNYFDSESGKPFPPTPGDQGDVTSQTGLQLDTDSCLQGNLVEDKPVRTAEFVRNGVPVRLTAVQGFFFCPAAFRSDLRRIVPHDPVKEAAFRYIERSCPRQFPPGGAHSVCNSDTCRRVYPTADTQLHIASDGAVTARFYGAVQKPFMGNVGDLSRGAVAVMCHDQLGRYTPWSPGENLLTSPRSPE